MNIKSIKFFVLFSSLLLILNACAKNEFFNNKLIKSVVHNRNGPTIKGISASAETVSMPRLKTKRKNKNRKKSGET